MSKGKIDLTETQIIPIEGQHELTDKGITFQFNTDTNVSWALQLSLDGENWGAAVDSGGSDITGSIATGAKSDSIMERMLHEKDGADAILARYIMEFNVLESMNVELGIVNI